MIGSGVDALPETIVENPGADSSPASRLRYSETMRRHAWVALLMLLPLHASAAAQPASPNSEPSAADSASERRIEGNGHKPFVGKVRSIADGDSIVVEDAEGYRAKVRLFGIDAPERGGGTRYGQPYAQRARKNLSELIYRKTVRVQWHTYDSYGRMIGQVWLDSADVGLRQICDGYAWLFRQYADELSGPDRKAYAECEETARAQRRGLWRDSRPVPPWEWRHSDRSKELEP
jgi:micrococcal nuclease